MYMPKEKSVPKRLSGSEALDSLMAEIYKRLCNHGHFHSHKAYQGYRATVNLVFQPAMSFAPPLTDDFEINTLDPGEVGADIFRDAMSVTIDIPMRPPNQVREEAGMDLPVQVEEGAILVEKWVKPSKFRGKTKPGTKAPSRASMAVPTVPGKLAEDELVEFGVAKRP
jgi:hypothetical protein